LEPKFYLPAAARRQEGKPGAYHFVEEHPMSPLTKLMRDSCKRAYIPAWAEYQHMVNAGVAKEQARIVLPLGIYTKVIWSCNPRSLMHFLSLRLPKQAMQEIRVVAEQAERALETAMPLSYAAFVANERTAP
jgi:thymidylate synthase (FAD)